MSKKEFPMPENVKAIKKVMFLGQPTTFHERNIVKIWEKKLKRFLKDKKTTPKPSNNIEGDYLIIKEATRFRR